MRLGILPAAGKSTRWGGYPKELLPISNGQTFIARAIDSLQLSNCDVIAIVTSQAKISMHAHHIEGSRNIVFAIQQGEELWGAITTAVEFPADEYYFMMPDTFLPLEPFPTSLSKSFGLGLFATEEPGRFGVLRDGIIVDKQPSSQPGRAWGTLAWTRSVVEYWKKESYRSHTDAFNDAMRVFGYDEWHLDYYYDIGNMTHYAEFLLSEFDRIQYSNQFPGLEDVVGKTLEAT